MASLFSSHVNAIPLREANTVLVEIDDSASGGCWTNLKEVRDYTEATLFNKGAVIARNDLGGFIEEKHLRAVISVTAQRLYADGTGPCHGSIAIRLDGLGMMHDTGGWFVIDEMRYITANKNNMNRATISRLSDFLKSLK